MMDALLVGSSLSGVPGPVEAARELAIATPLPQGKGISLSVLDRDGQETGYRPRLPAFLEPYRGQFVPELPTPVLDQFEDAFVDAQADLAFAVGLETFMTYYLGRPTAATELHNLPLEGDACILLKHEDLIHGGTHKGN